MSGRWLLFISHHRRHGSTGLHSEWLLQPSWLALHSSPVCLQLTVPPQTELTSVIEPGSACSRLKVCNLASEVRDYCIETYVQHPANEAQWKRI